MQLRIPTFQANSHMLNTLGVKMSDSLSDNVTKPIIEGQCLCGNVKYILKDEPVEFVTCDCEDCKRVSGAVSAVGFGLLKSCPEIQGNVKYLHFEDRVRTFAPCCGTHLFWRHPDGSIYVVLNSLAQDMLL